MIRVRPVCIAGLMLASVAVKAEEIRWNGFLNVVGGVLKEEPTQAFGDKGAPEYDGYETDLTFLPQSSAGLQAMYPLDPQNSVTLQLFSEGADGSYDVDMKWLYLTHYLSDNSTFRVGRIGSPVYYYSDFLNVGYAYHWVAPPTDVYNFDTTITGIDYIYQDVFNDNDWSFEVITGAEDQDLPTSNAHISVRNALGVIFSFTHDGWLTFRTSAFQMDANIELADLDSTKLIDAGFVSAVDQGILTQADADALKPALAPGMASLIEDVLLMEDAKLRYYDLALRAEKGRWFSMAEWTQFRTDTYVYNWVESWYVTGGVKTDGVVYHLTYARYDEHLDEQARLDNNHAFPEPATLDALADHYARLIRAAPAIRFASQWNTITAGVSIDTSDSTVLKFEVLHFDNEPTTPNENTGVGHNMLFRTALNVTF